MPRCAWRAVHRSFVCDAFAAQRQLFIPPEVQGAAQRVRGEPEDRQDRFARGLHPRPGQTFHGVGRSCQYDTIDVDRRGVTCVNGGYALVDGSVFSVRVPELRSA
eukprot:9166998-Pyramimonas_sp.AAC.1